jgi:hypothetical protein
MVLVLSSMAYPLLGFQELGSESGVKAVGVGAVKKQRVGQNNRLVMTW